MRATLRPKTLDFDNESGKVLRAVRLLLDPAGGLTPREYQFMFQDVYALCTAFPAPFTRELYACMRTFFTDHVHQCRQVCAPHPKHGGMKRGCFDIKQQQMTFSPPFFFFFFFFFLFFFFFCALLLGGQEIESHPADVLQAYQNVFEVYYRGCHAIHKAFEYMNKELENIAKTGNLKFGVGSEAEYIPMEALALRLWRDNLLLPLKDRLVHAILAEVSEADDDDDDDDDNGWFCHSLTLFLHLLRGIV